MRKVVVLLLIVLQYFGVTAKNVELELPGSLCAVLTKTEKDTLTSIVISGKIDTRDFKTMRDSMAMLKSVDISNADIVFYSGYNGTNSTTTNKVYAADAVPVEAFYGACKLVTVVLPTSATCIENNAFVGCVSIAKIAIGNMVVSIGQTAFRNCSAYLTVGSGNTFYSAENGLLFDKAKTTVLSCPISATGTITLPTTVRLIRSYVFENCVMLDKVVIPESVLSIEQAAFRNCSADFNVSGANAIYSSKSGVLYSKDRSTLIQCSVKTDGVFEVASAVKTIGYCAFFNCVFIRQMVIPRDVKVIEPYAFSGCSGLESVIVYSLTPIAIQKNDFNGVHQNSCVLSVPKGTKPLYESQYFWYRFENIVEFVPTAIEENGAENCFVVSEGGIEVNTIAKPLRVAVVDVLGRLVLSQEIIGNAFVDFHQLGRGVFVVSVNGQSTKIVRR